MFARNVEYLRSCRLIVCVAKVKYGLEVEQHRRNTKNCDDVEPEKRFLPLFVVQLQICSLNNFQVEEKNNKNHQKIYVWLKKGLPAIRYSTLKKKNSRIIKTDLQL